MARDDGLEELLHAALAGTPGLETKPMFGGLAWLLNGHLLCGARVGRLLVRVGKPNEPWALKLPGVERTVMGGRPMPGWVWAAPEAYGDDAVRARLLDAALAFNRTLPAKE